MPRPAERRRVERLDGVRPVARLVGEQPAQDEALGAQRVGHERVGRDRDAALVVDRGDRRAQRPERLDRLLDPEREQVPAEGRDLLADDDLERQAAVPRDGPAGERGVDPLVVGDGDDVELGVALDVVEDLDDARRAVRGEGVDVEVGAAEPVGHPAASRRVAARCPVTSGARAAAARGSRRARGPPSRSGQIGWKTASHCSGAAAMCRSKARALGREPGRHALAARALGGERHRLGARVVHARARRARPRRRAASRPSRARGAPVRPPAAPGRRRARCRCRRR